MNRILFSLGFLLLLLAPFSGQAQRYDGPGDYYREFFSANRRIQMKKVRYLENALSNADPRRTQRYREMALEQVEESLKSVPRISDYKGDSVVLKEYLKALKLYKEAFGGPFAQAEKLGASRYASYDSLKLYYQHFNEGERLMLDADYIIQEAHDYFFNQYTYKPRLTSDIGEKLDRIDELSLYFRDVNLAFYRVDAVLKQFFQQVENEQRDSLSATVAKLRRAVKTSEETAQSLEGLQGNNDPVEDLQDYLEEVNDNIDKEIRPLAEQLANEFLPADDYEDAMDDLEDLQEWHEKQRSTFLEDQNEVITEYLEED